MTGNFDYFVVFAEMRTGSNFLETNLNAYADITCHGEAFNPAFPGYPNRQDVLGITMEAREKDPLALVHRIRDQQGINGFRYFHDHDPRILDAMLDDARCAKVILTRNPVESYVSYKIAKATGQWKLTNVGKRREARALFEAAEFEQHVSALQAFQVQLMNRLQQGGQTAFYIDYEDLQSVEVMNGLARWLGSDHRIDELDKSLKVQNPEPLSEKIENFDAVPRALERLDRFNLSRTPNFEPRRGPMVPGYVASSAVPLLYMPVKGGPEVQVTDWMAMLGGGPDALIRDFSQKSLRDWMDHNPGHRAFTVIRHPLVRAHHVFCRRILDPGDAGFPLIRRKLRKHFDLNLPDGWPDVALDRDGHASAFAAFLRFVKANLAGQTSIRMDGHWASQSVLVQSFAEFALPDMIVREDEMGALLPALAMQAGGGMGTGEPAEAGPDHPFALAEIHAPELDRLARDAWPRDFQLFGFADWRPTG